MLIVRAYYFCSQTVYSFCPFWGVNEEKNMNTNVLSNNVTFMSENYVNGERYMWEF